MVFIRSGNVELRRNCISIKLSYLKQQASSKRPSNQIFDLISRQVATTKITHLNQHVLVYANDMIIYIRVTTSQLMNQSNV